MSGAFLSVANMLSILRLLFVPVLVILAVRGNSQWFLLILAGSLLSDVLDGYLARLLGEVSDFGAKLDSWGDALTYAVMIFGLYQLWPAIFHDQLEYLISATLSFVVPLLLALVKFGEYPSYHTVGAKIAAVLIAPAYYLLILMGADMLFRAVILFYLAVALEEIIITLLLKHPITNVGSVWQLTRGKSMALRKSESDQGME
jgi:CDP-diacylglycerol--glycerol-3-phosphate 3-phosphatidyltransferase